MYRTVSVNFTNFKDSRIQQLELFKSDKEIKEEIINESIDRVNLKYGQNIIKRAISLKQSSTLNKQNKLLAGHKA
ncbi:hypothetical protein MHZ36_12860 [Staphylococcus sp. ACRSN]|uniref:hypothetical protein n=1 Tax=Staphylococcus sp. ACRSN TaxID=2918214 RepID=UPI001EF1EC02|nr:hypothetical protein [Staphylococcus sp. ACRSN]MCG7340180.1 hypothetical protein [Staphylococcus sp. ACRSN]